MGLDLIDSNSGSKDDFGWLPYGALYCRLYFPASVHRFPFSFANVSWLYSFFFLWTPVYSAVLCGTPHGRHAQARQWVLYRFGLVRRSFNVPMNNDEKRCQCHNYDCTDCISRTQRTDSLER